MRGMHIQYGFGENVESADKNVALENEKRGGKPKYKVQIVDWSKGGSEWQNDLAPGEISIEVHKNLTDKTQREVLLSLIREDFGDFFEWRPEKWRLCSFGETNH